MKVSTRNGVHWKLLTGFLLFIVLFGCKKTDPLAEPSTSNEGASTTQRAAPKPSAETADVVYQWYKYIAQVQLPVAQPSVFAQTRAFAYIGVGLFEAVQPGIKGGSSFGPKLYQMPAMPKPDMSKDYLWSASANAALASMFKLYLPTLTNINKAAIDAMETSIYNSLKSMASEAVLQRSADFGRSIATAIFDWSATDNFSIASTSYVQINEPWAWIPTPPNFPAPVAADLRYSRPMLKYSLSAIAPPIPIPFSTDPSSDFYKAAKEVHDLGGSLTGTAANKATADWWADAGGVGVGLPPPYHLLSIITTVLESQKAGLWKAAEVYAKTGIAIKDGPIITFRSKYHYNLLRPITYIRRYIDPSWLSYLTNPAYPDYTSGLVGLYGPAINVLINEFGDIPVTDNAYWWRPLPARSFSSLSELLAQAAVSRVYAGIHYRFTQNVSIGVGADLAREIDKVRVVGPEYQ